MSSGDGSSGGAAGITDFQIADDAQISPHKIRGGGYTSPTGFTFYVNSTGSPPGTNLRLSNNNGRFSNPIRTIQQAHDKCVAGRGDVVIVGPFHAESPSASITLSKNGVKVIFLGQGDSRPTITFGTTTHKFVVSGSNVVCMGMDGGGLIIKSNAAIVDMVSVTGANCLVQDIDLREGTAAFVNGITVSTTGPVKSVIRNVKMYHPTSTASAVGILVSNAFADLLIQNVTINGGFQGGCLKYAAGAHLFHRIIDAILWNTVNSGTASLNYCFDLSAINSATADLFMKNCTFLSANNPADATPANRTGLMPTSGLARFDGCKALDNINATSAVQFPA